MHKGEVVYRRGLPGGGFVAIYTLPVRSLLGQRRVEGNLVVERRDPDRRTGHEPPVVARATGDDAASVFERLFPVAQSNTLVAAHCLAAAREKQSV
jgi:hypothetical protein